MQGVSTPHKEDAVPEARLVPPSFQNHRRERLSPALVALGGARRWKSNLFTEGSRGDARPRDRCICSSYDQVEARKTLILLGTTLPFRAPPTPL